MSGSSPSGSPRPEVTLKLATSLDGRIATASGESKWITGPLARRCGHLLRARHDAVVAGSGTVLADDPQLTARTDPPVDRQPLRIIVDGRGRTPASASVFATLSAGPVAMATQETTDLDSRGWPSVPGVQYWMLPPGHDQRGVDLWALLETAFKAGVRSLLVEGGGQLAASFIRLGVVDRLEWFRAPVLLGSEGRPCVGALALERLGEAPAFRRTRIEELGPDLWETYQLRTSGDAG